MILVTGGAGYVGSHINKLLSQKGYETVVLDNLLYGHAEAVKWGSLENMDMGDNAKLNALFEKYKFDTVFHFAAFTYVGESVDDPAKYYTNNVTNTVKLLDAMREHGAKRIIFSSSCATYGEPQRVPIREEDPQSPISPYGRTKLIMEQILADYHRAYGLSYCALRYFNAAGADPDNEIGEDHNPETHLIPLVLEAADRGSPVSVFGSDYPTRDGSCIRDYIHISDLARAHLYAMEYLKDGGESRCINLGNGVGISVLEIIEAARRVTGKNIAVELCDRRAGDPPELVGSAELAKKLLNWEPELGDIDTIIKHAWTWYQSNNKC